MEARMVWGAAVPLAWLFTMTASRDVSGFPPYARFLFYLGLGGWLLVYAMQPAARRVSQSRACLPCCTAVLALTPILVCVSSVLPSALSAAVMLLAGAALAMFSLRWFGVCCSRDGEETVRLVLLSFALAAALRLSFAVSPGPAWVSLAIVAALVVMSASFLHQVEYHKQANTVDQPGMPASNPGERNENALSHDRIDWFYLAEIAVCSLVLGCSRGIVADSPVKDASLALNYALRIAVPLGLYAWTYLRGRGRAARPVRYALMAVLMALLALCAFGGDGMARMVSHALLLLAWDFTLMTIYLAAVRIAESTGSQAELTLARYRGPYDLLLGAGMCAEHLLGEAGLLPGVSNSVVLFLLGAVFLLVVNRLLTVMESNDMATEAEPEDATPRDTVMRSIVECCRQAAAQASLSERELQIMTYLCQGFSKGWVADELGLSENTVRWHTKNLYEKMGVHSKQELLALVMGEASQEGQA